MVITRSVADAQGTPTWIGATARAVAATCVMAVGLGGAGAIAANTGLTGTTKQALTAVICLVLVVPLIMLLRQRVDRLPMAGLGLIRGRNAVLGVAVTGGSAAVVLGLGTWAGWLEWGPIDSSKLVEFVIVNAVIAFALEAFPEELVFRGYVYDTLDRALRQWKAFLGTIVLFTFAGAASSVVYAVVGTLLGEQVPAPGFAPPGEDPVAYAVLYPIFGATLLIARITTGSLWTSIALHLTYLTAVRITFDGEARDAGWAAEQTTPDALLLVPAFLLLAALVFLAIRKLGLWRSPTT